MFIKMSATLAKLHLSLSTFLFCQFVAFTNPNIAAIQLSDLESPVCVGPFNPGQHNVLMLTL